MIVAVSPTLRTSLGALLIIPVLLLAAVACSDDDPEPATGSGLPSQAELKRYFEAVTSGDPDVIETVREEVASPGSPADHYAGYVASAAAAAEASGAEAGAAEVEAVDGGFQACIGPEQCVAWTSLEGRDGRLASFAVAGTPLSESLVALGDQSPVEIDGLYRVQPLWAYRLPSSGLLNVVVEVTAFDVALAPKPGSYIEADVILKGVAAPSPEKVAPGETHPVVLAFPDAAEAELDGEVTFNLRIAGAGAESIGFGLAQAS